MLLAIIKLLNYTGEGVTWLSEGMSLSFPFSLKAKKKNKLGTTLQESRFGKAEFVFALRQSAYPGCSAGFVKPFCPKTVC